MSVCAICTTKGPVRQVNQDACCAVSALTPLGEVCMAAVCDGVGGLPCGELASSTVTRGLMAWFEKDLPRLLSHMGSKLRMSALRDAWHSQILVLNERVHSYGRVHDIVLGTTLTAVLSCGESFMVAQVGDSRAYLLSQGKLDLLTTDQTLATHMATQYDLRACQVPASRQSNVILQAVGASDVVKPAYCGGRLSEGDLVLVCSDGAYRTAEEDALRRTLSCASAGGASVRAACAGVIEDAMRAGEQDNVTAVCMLHSTPVKHKVDCFDSLMGDKHVCGVRNASFAPALMGVASHA